MTRRAVTILLSLAFVSASVAGPMTAAGGATPKAKARQTQDQNAGRICGDTKDASQKATPRTTLRLRNQRTGALVRETTSDDDARYCFGGVPPGTYVVEMLDAAGNIVGTSASVTLSTTAMVASGVTVTSTAAGVIGGAAGGAAAGGAAAGAGAAGAGSFFGTTLGIVTLATAGGIAAIATARAVTNDASASQ